MSSSRRGPVALIAPDTRRMVLPPAMRRVQGGVGVLPPLGLLSLASSVRRRCDTPVCVIDGNLAGLSADAIASQLQQCGASIAGIGCLTLNLPEVLRIARAVRERLPECRIVLGGPHPTLYPAETLRHPSVDYVVRGEGEHSFAMLVERLGEGERDVADIPGVMDDVSPLKEPHCVESLDDIPFPDRELLPVDRYRTVASRRPPTTVIFSSRGCPFRCIFCNTAGGKAVRRRDPAAVAQEMAQCRRLGIRECFFFDESFTLHREHVELLCRALIDSKSDMEWEARSRVDCVDGELLRLMARAGCRRIRYGVESGVQGVLDALGKGITVEQARDAFQWTRAAGIRSCADFMIGSPGEGPGEIEETLAFARALDPDYVHFAVTIPYPFTELYRMAQERGVVRGDPWRQFAEDPREEFEVPYYTETVSREKLEAYLDRAFREFYLRPSYLARALRQIASPGEMARHAAAAFRLFRGART